MLLAAELGPAEQNGDRKWKEQIEIFKIGLFPAFRKCENFHEKITAQSMKKSAFLEKGILFLNGKR